MIPGIFITGTDTGVGKTLVTTGVLRWMRARSINAMMMKPVQTGAISASNGRLLAPDVEEVLQRTRLSVDAETRAQLAPYLFEPACSPHLAARLAGRQIELAKILETAHWLATRYEQLIVEGAGGLMVPLNERQTMLDLAAILGMPVLLVGDSGLGTINHVLLSLEALRRRSLHVLGVILNDVQPVPVNDRYIHEDNVHAIESSGQVRVLARVPYLGQQACELCALDAALAHGDFLPAQNTRDQHRFREGKRELR